MADNRLKAVATARAYDQGNIATLDDAMTRRLVASTVLTESYGGDLGPINRLGYVGRYQAGAAWLVDAGYIDMEKYRAARNSMSGREWERGGGQLRFMQDAGNWNDGLSLDRYLASDDLQDRAFRTNCNRSYRQAIRNGLLDENATPETVAGFLKARHLSGYEGARGVVQGGRVIRDENGTSNYDYFHDITRNRDGLNELMQRTQQQAPTPGRTQDAAPSVQTPPGTQANGGPGSFGDAMRIMLPPQNGVSPHVTGHFGEERRSRPDAAAHTHQGTDFNYAGGQTGLNLRHPTVHSPVTGTVESVGGRYGTVGIRDGQGNLHQILHLHSQEPLRPGQPIQAGDPIGTMGGRGPNRADEFRQHVHYQVFDRNGRAIDPERFWNNRMVDAPTQPGTQLRSQRSEAMADGVLRLNDRGPEVQALQRSLNELGYRGRNGQPLETTSGVFGSETKHAVEAFQRAHGLGVDGKAGRDTLPALASASEKPLLSEATHPNHRLYAHFGRELPAGTPPAAVANVTLQALENGISRPDQIRGIGMRGSDVVIARQGVDPGDRFQVDLGAPTATMQQMSDHTRRQSLQPAEPTPLRVQPDVQDLAPRTVSI